jgi:hypothetical protein
MLSNIAQRNNVYWIKFFVENVGNDQIRLVNRQNQQDSSLSGSKLLEKGYSLHLDPTIFPRK